ncbi:MAG: hypothetical protein H0X49_13130 [Acidobacteria bacterium]|jgi:hypothetical protein|nr:hypothetical protein [Acidobacteriota bacterium]MBA4184932.1 hypothetical protein [Acidobacteriota bacterium]
MGMFDYLKCEYPLPDSTVQNETFQTKSLDKVLGDYTITADGRLILHAVSYESVPEEERPYYDKPEWKKPFGKICGSLTSSPTGDVEIAYHGDVRFYTSVGSRENNDYEWFEYQARFTDGKLQWVKRIEQK